MHTHFNTTPFRTPYVIKLTVYLLASVLYMRSYFLYAFEHAKSPELIGTAFLMLSGCSFVLAAYYSFKKLRTQRARFDVTPEGIVDHYWGVGLIPWSEIKKASIYTGNPKENAGTFIQFQLENCLNQYKKITRQSAYSLDDCELNSLNHSFIYRIDDLSLDIDPLLHTINQFIQAQHSGDEKLLAQLCVDLKLLSNAYPQRKRQVWKTRLRFAVASILMNPLAALATFWAPVKLLALVGLIENSQKTFDAFVYNNLHLIFFIGLFIYPSGKKFSLKSSKWVTPKKTV